MLHIGTHDSRGAFGTEGHCATAAIFEHVHLFANHIRRCANPLEHFEMFEYRRNDQTETRVCCQVSERRYHLARASRLRGQHVVGSNWGAQGL